jgi:UDP:flavonoid glycosyltransferase YjiC (YdhE family)
VLFVSGSQWEDAVRREGLAFEGIGVTAPVPEDADFGWVLWERGRTLAPGIADTLREWRTDLAVVDTLTVAGWFAADLAGVPRVELVPTSYQRPSRALPPPGSGLAPGRTPLGRGRDAVLRRLHARSLRRGEEACAAARKSLGLPPEAAPVSTLVATLPGLEPERPDWPAGVQLVGPMEWDPATTDLAEPAGDGPLVFLADSSATGRPQTLLDVATIALQGMRVACTRFAPYGGVLPDGMTAGPGRQAPLLHRASVVVCAGGHGMVTKALVRGLPLVVVPGPGDQRENAARVARLGAGVHLPPAKLTPQTLRAAVERVLTEPSYAAAARRLAATAEGLGPDFAARGLYGIASVCHTPFP